MSTSDDFPASPATTGVMTLDVPVTGRIDSAGDVDVFKIALVAGTTYQLTLQPADGAPTYSFLSLELDGADGKKIDNNYLDGKSYSYTPSVSGTYTLAVRDGQNTPSNYTLSATLAPDDYGASPATAGALDLGSKLNATLDVGGGDRDWFGVSLEAGQTYWFTERGVSDPSLPSDNGTLALRVLNAQGTALATLNTPYLSGVSTLSFVAPTKGTYYFEVGGQCHDQATGAYQVQVQQGVADDYGNTPASATALQWNTEKDGQLEVNSDKDVFKISVMAGNTYGINLVATGTDPVWQHEVNVIATDASGASVPLRLTQTYPYLRGLELLTATSTGDLYLTVYSGGTIDDRSGGYQITATDYGADDYPASFDTTAQLAPGQKIQGKIGFLDDHDYVKVHLEAGRSYAFDLEGALSGGGTLNTSGMSGFNLYGSGNASYPVAASQVQYGAEARLSYQATATGDYYLDIHGDGKLTGTYTMAMVQTSGDLRAPQLASSSVPDGATGVATHPSLVLAFDEIIALGDTQGIQIQDAAGHVVKNSSFSLEASANGQQLTLDPHLNLQPGASYSLVLPAGSVIDLAGNPIAATTLHFTIAAAAATGSAANDYLTGSGTGAHIDGGTGSDTAFYAQPAEQYQYKRNADGSVMVQLNGAASGDTLTNVERVVFPNYAISFDANGHDAQIYRLYQAAFNRPPDAKGLGFWMSMMDHGASLGDVASAYIQSAEFRNLYGDNTSDTQFITLLYSNVLHRTPDANGLAFWQDALHKGASHTDLLTSFSESTENQAALVNITGSGFPFIPFG